MDWRTKKFRQHVEEELKRQLPLPLKLKRCSCCKVEKPIADFQNHRRRKDGKQPWCRPCQNAVMLQWGRDNPEQAAAKSARWAERHPKKKEAHRAVQRAVKKGLLIKTPCEVCGEKKVEGHHDDYDKPLVVRWLCHKHHMELHRLDPDLPT